MVLTSLTLICTNRLIFSKWSRSTYLFFISFFVGMVTNPIISQIYFLWRHHFSSVLGKPLLSCMNMHASRNFFWAFESCHPTDAGLYRSNIVSAFKQLDIPFRSYSFRSLILAGLTCRNFPVSTTYSKLCLFQFPFTHMAVCLKKSVCKLLGIVFASLTDSQIQSNIIFMKFTIYPLLLL